MRPAEQGRRPPTVVIRIFALVLGGKGGQEDYRSQRYEDVDEVDEGDGDFDAWSGRWVSQYKQKSSTGRRGDRQRDAILTFALVSRYLGSAVTLSPPIVLTQHEGMEELRMMDVQEQIIQPNNRALDQIKPVSGSWWSMNNVVHNTGVLQDKI